MEIISNKNRGLAWIGPFKYTFGPLKNKYIFV